MFKNLDHYTYELNFGTEPKTAGYKSAIFPVKLIEHLTVAPHGIEPRRPGCKPGILPPYARAI